MSTSLTVYVSGPLTQGDVVHNIRTALGVSRDLEDMGILTYVPHLSHFEDMIFPKPYKSYIARDLKWVSKCDAIYRIPGESPGADLETNLAKSLGMPVFTSIEEVGRYLYATETQEDDNGKEGDPFDYDTGQYVPVEKVLSE